MSLPALDLSGIVKDYRGLRPLRIERLVVAPGEHVAIVGLDEPSAETLVNLVTGATLPDRGEVRAFGEPTSAIESGDEWLAAADRFGIVSRRAVLLESLTVVQNLSMPFSLEIEPPAPHVRRQAEALAREAGLDPATDDRQVAGLDPVARARVRLARGVALEPAVLLVEHLTAELPRPDVAPLARQIRAVAARRGIAALTLTADAEFAQAVAARVLTLAPATGRLTEGRRRWWSRTGT